MQLTVPLGKLPTITESRLKTLCGGESKRQAGNETEKLTPPHLWWRRGGVFGALLLFCAAPRTRGAARCVGREAGP